MISIKAKCLIAISSITLFVIGFYCQRPSSQSDNLIQSKHVHSYLHFKGLTIHDSTDSKQRIILEVEEFTMRPKRYYVFTLRPFDEIILKEAKVTVENIFAESMPGKRSNDAVQLGFPKIEPPLNIFQNQSKALVSGVHLNGFIWELKESNRSLFKCSAKYGYIDTSKRKIELEHLELINYINENKIVASKGHFDLTTNIFNIENFSIINFQGAVLRGKTIRCDISLTPLGTEGQNTSGIITEIHPKVSTGES